jgi:hypothetical protein
MTSTNRTENMDRSAGHLPQSSWHTSVEQMLSLSLSLSLTGQALIFEGKNRWYSPRLTSDHSGEILASIKRILVDTLIF